MVKSWLSPAQQGLLDKFAPERISLPNGKKWKITYDAKAAPTIAARIQDLYGVEGNLTIAAGRVPLVIQVLAPNQRPVQITQNLSTFWAESYPEAEAGTAAEISEARVAVRRVNSGAFPPGSATLRGFFRCHSRENRIHAPPGQLQH